MSSTAEQAAPDDDPRPAQPEPPVDLRTAAVRPQLLAVAEAVLGRGERTVAALGDVHPGVAADAGAADAVTTGPAPEPVDVVWAGPDELAALVAAGTLGAALGAARAALRPGGLVVLAAPTPAEVRAGHASSPTTCDEDGATRVTVHRFAADGRHYDRHELRLALTDDGWTTTATAPLAHRVPEPDEVSEALEGVGFWSPQLLLRSDTGLGVAVWAAVAPADDAEVAPSTDGSTADGSTADRAERAEQVAVDAVAG